MGGLNDSQRRSPHIPIARRCFRNDNYCLSGKLHGAILRHDQYYSQYCSRTFVICVARPRRSRFGRWCLPATSYCHLIEYSIDRKHGSHPISGGFFLFINRHQAKPAPSRLPARWVQLLEGTLNDADPAGHCPFQERLRSIRSLFLASVYPGLFRHTRFQLEDLHLHGF